MEIGKFKNDNLIAGDHPVITEQAILETGQNLKRGALLGMVESTGKWVLSDATSNDGSEIPRRILAQDMDASTEDMIVPTYLAGEFNENSIIFGSGHTAESVKKALQDVSVYLKPSLKHPTT